MSTNPQWKSFQPPSTTNQDSAILDFKTMTSSAKSQAFNFNNRSTSNSRFGSDFPSVQDKCSSFNSNLYGSPSATNATGRFPIGTFSLDTNNMYNSSGDSLSNSVFSNGNSNSGYSDSNSANLGTRETGIIEKLLHSYGFIQCCERQARLFFHFSQFSGNIEHLKIGDPVEFEMTYDRRTGKPIASAVTKISPEVVMSEERVTGTVTTELRGEGSSGDTQGRISYENRGECFFLPYTKDDVEGNVTLRSGDKVSFQIATNNRGNLGACHVRLENPAHPVKYQGVVCSMKESFGFIERADVVKEIFFHFSEAKTKEELRLGDDVEFIIQTRNGKEVACNITRLPTGTVIFEDLKPEILRGQVLKPLDRGNNSRHQTDALPGRIRYRAPDHSEVEISFGEKDQRGDFTLKHGDWVQFKIATDRRDQLNRATQIMLLEESFMVSGERREQGIVASVKDGFGFLRCVEREVRLFFHFNEMLDVDHDVQVGDEFEFTVIQDQTSTFSNNRQSAIRMKLLLPGTVQFEISMETNMTGVVTKDIPNSWANRSPTKSQNGEHVAESGAITYQSNGVKKTVSFYSKDCDVRHFPKHADKVHFNINQIKRNKELIAVNIQVVQSAPQTNGTLKHNSRNCQMYQGFIAALKDGFGFIETVDHDREVFFHFSNFDGDPSSLELGQEVEYNLGIRGGNSGSCSSAENVKLIPKGSINLPAISGETLEGYVVRPLRSVNPDQNEYSGLIRVKMESPDEQMQEYDFGIMGLVNKRELLQINDHVQFQIDLTGRAANITAVRKKLRATVDAIKGQFGFLAYEVEEGKKLFFHISEVKDKIDLQIGDQVEFVLVTNHRSGKSSACNVVKVRCCVAKKNRVVSASVPAKVGTRLSDVMGKHLPGVKTVQICTHSSRIGCSSWWGYAGTTRLSYPNNIQYRSKFSDVQARPERLFSRLRTISLDDTGPRLIVIRQPRGPDGSQGFSADIRYLHQPGCLSE